MNVLFVLPYPPTVIRVRPYNFIRCLAQGGDRVSVVAAVDSREQTAAETPYHLCQEALQTSIGRAASYANCLRALFLSKDTPLQVAFCRSGKVRSVVMRLITKENFDVIHVESLRALQYVKNAKKLPVVFDAVDCVSSLYEQFSAAERFLPKRVLKRLEWKRLMRYESRAPLIAQRITVTTELEAEKLRALNPNFQPIAIQNGTDLSEFFPAKKESDENRIVFCGKMSYVANEDAVIRFYKEAFPSISNSVPQAKFYVVGSAPGKKITALSKDPRVIVTGFVANTLEYLHHARVAVIPIFAGGGIQNKALEAMAAGIPVVTTPLVAKSLGLTDGQNALIADSFKGIAAKTVELMRAPEKRRAITQRALDYVREKFNWEKAVIRLRKVYEEVIEEPL